MHLSTWPNAPCALLLAAAAVQTTHCMQHEEILALKQETRDLFYHGFDNYMLHAFPEDELKPLSCQPQTRNRENLADIGLNDVLGNYSLTLIDSLSTLAILASDQEVHDGRNALSDFQEGVKSIVDLYGDGTRDENGQVACGQRACGFDLDSKVQVFETNIRGVGGLLSAHLFSVGDLPIKGYNPDWAGQPKARIDPALKTPPIRWNTSAPFVYDGQLLRLAHDLALRLTPAFSTSTGLPYPRVNLRSGIPFYRDSDAGFCRSDGTSSDPHEITETCAAGAGSLVLEFTTLSRLSGDSRFEKLAKRAFWAVWERRSSIGLIGNGIDAESGVWTSPALAGIGAGIDSFFEYAVKSYILLDGVSQHTDHEEPDSPRAFLGVWQKAYAAVRRHIYRGRLTEKFPFYGQVDLTTGAPRYGWIDNLSAYWPGLLTLVGELDEAIESHLLFSALWTHYSALPERWHAVNAWIDPNFRHWAGRPEFIESTWYLYRATKDPWYLHVGEMAIRDIKRRCWTSCGWADLGDVTTGEMRDRMESFFLGETAKYLFLLFDDAHPLNHIDDAVVFTTEGHPLVIPKKYRSHNAESDPKASERANKRAEVPVAEEGICPAPLPPLPLTVSNIANRADFFHAAALAELHLVPVQPARPSPLLDRSHQYASISYSDVRSPTNYSWYPWPLSHQLIPADGSSLRMDDPVLSTLTFPNLLPPSGSADSPALALAGLAGQQQAAARLSSQLLPLSSLQRTLDGILINSLSNVRLNMVQEPRSPLSRDGSGSMIEQDQGVAYRVHGIGNWALGRDEKVWIGERAMKGLSLEGISGDTHSPLRRVKDREWVDLVIEVTEDDASPKTEPEAIMNGQSDLWEDLKTMLSGFVGSDTLDAIAQGLSPIEIATVALSSSSKSESSSKRLSRSLIPAILPTGPGAAPLPTSVDLHQELLSSLIITNPTKPPSTLPFTSIYYLDSTLCNHRLPLSIARNYNVLVIKRGECSFSDKISNIPTYTPLARALQLVVVRDVEWTPQEEVSRDENDLIKPLLDRIQKSPSGMERRFGIPVVMVDGRSEVRRLLKRAAGSANIGSFGKDGELITMNDDVENGDGGGLGVKRRFWFESLGILVDNLLVA